MFYKSDKPDKSDKFDGLLVMFQLNLPYFWGVSNKTVTPLALVKYIIRCFFYLMRDLFFNCCTELINLSVKEGECDSSVRAR